MLFLYGIKTGVNSDINWTDEYLDDLFFSFNNYRKFLATWFSKVFWLSGDENEGIYYYDDTYNQKNSDENNAPIFYFALLPNF